MIAEKFVLKSWQILAMVLSGTLVRLVFGIYGKSWMASPDQLAWEISLAEMIQSGTLSYKQLIHYPHEGGSLLISLVAICLRPLDFILPSLSLSALLFDTVSRWIQIYLTQKIFGSLTSAWFALWTILAVPLLLPWATVNFGLHSLAAFLPFVFIYFTTTHQSNRPDGVICGLVAGLSVTFAYDNIIFFPAWLIWKLFDSGKMSEKIQASGRFIGVGLLALVPHLLLRLFADNGFHLSEHSITSIRGIVWGEIFSSHSLNHLFTVWQKHLPASFFLAAGNWVSASDQRFLIQGFFMAAVVFSLAKQYKAKGSFVFALLLIIVYTTAFALSPFYTDFSDSKSYVYFRHFAYLLPFVALIIINGFVQSGKFQMLLSGLWLIFCMYFSIAYMAAAVPEKSASYKAAGWVLAGKYGEKPEKLKRLRDTALPIYREDLMIGFGWGLAATLLEEENNIESEKVRQLKNLYSQFTVPDRILIMNGIELAFSPGVTPVLEGDLYHIFDVP